MKEELHSEIDDVEIGIRQRGQRTDRPRRKTKVTKKAKNNTRCIQVIDELLQAMRPLTTEPSPDQPYWFFAKHVVGSLNSMRKLDAECAVHDILKLLDENNYDVEPT